MPIPLGPFQLMHPIGRGGMGVVWLGHHTAQGVPVAVKVITGKAANTEEYRRAFQQEVRAVSALDHPGVVWIFDSGTIPPESVGPSNGELVAGSPYLVMEYASHGTLRQLTRVLSWAEVKGILMSLLDALAHAHARGVLHRDLKPDNVLIAGSEDLRPGFKITDFGIARPLDDTAANEERPVGTPQYMAPEQIRNDTDQYGPHTDLYALGNLAWRLVTGKLPFHGMKGANLMYAQLQKPAPPLVPAIAVPRDLEAFLRTLLAKEPHDRFQRAADAALALASLPDPAGTVPSLGFRLERALVASNPAGARAGGEELDLDTATLKIVLTQRRSTPVEVGAAIRPPFPQTWRLPPTASRPLRLMGAGLGLFGVRPVPLVGREAERDVLWKSLFDVHHERRARVVVVRGPPGVGRSRLVQWVADRAHEVGGATVLKTAFTTSNTALEHLRRSLVRLLRSHPLAPEVRNARFDELFSGVKLDHLAVADAIELLLDPDRRELPEPQRQALIRRIWEILSIDRPLMIVFDDAQWGPESLKLAKNLLDAQEARPSPILVVLTVQADAVGQQTEVSRLVDGLTHRRGARLLELRPFEGEQRVDLVQELLGFDHGLADQVADCTEGNPLFAVQLVGDWIDRQVLVSGPTGFVLSDPDLVLPSSLQEVWDGRIRGLVGGLEPPALEQLERAAVLGREVDVLEWQAVCDDTEGRHAATGRACFNPRHARLRHALMDRLLANRLGQATDRGFVFSHALFRDALVTRAENAGRYRNHAACAAAVLVHRITDADAERVGRLLADSGRIEPALDALFRAERFLRKTSGVAAALDLLDDVEQILKRARVKSRERGWAELAARRGSALAALGRTDDAIRAARTAYKLAIAGGWVDLRIGSAAVLGTVSPPGEAEAHWLEVVGLLGDTGDVATTIKSWHRLRRIALANGDAALAHTRGEQVRAALARATDDEARAVGLGATAEYLQSDGQLDEAASNATEAAEIASRIGDLPGEAKARSLLARIAEDRQELVRAREEWYHTVQLLDALGSTRNATLARCRLALVECRTGHFAGARETVEVVLEEGEPEDPVLRAGVHAVLTLAAAGRARWERFDTHIQVCEALYPTLGARDTEYAEVMLLAGDHALRRHQNARAVRAWTLAEARYVRHGATEKIEILRRRIATLGAT